jgi:phosphate:Na+ symporter
MERFETLVVIIASIALFVYGLQSFSKEIEGFGSEKLSKWIGKVTAVPLGGFILGGVLTSVIQSSTLVSSLTVSLVNTGIGNTATAWIVSMQSAFLGPFFIVLGVIISMIPSRVSVIGKSIFYFGFIFFSLSYISQAMDPIKNDPMLIEILSKASNPLMGIIYGIVITVIIQSSSVVVGLVVVLIGQGTIGIDIAIPIVVGANIGTTSTALIVSLKLSPISKLVALSASLFNLIGVIVIFPFFGLLSQLAQTFSDDGTLQVAFAFTVSNTFTSVLFLIMLTPTINLLKKHRWYKEAKKLNELSGFPEVR